MNFLQLTPSQTVKLKLVYSQISIRIKLKEDVYSVSEILNCMISIENFKALMVVQTMLKPGRCGILSILWKTLENVVFTCTPLTQYVERSALL